MIPTCTAQALKEWAAVCAALREGKQVFLLRKGGIHERCGEFSVEHDAFFLYPTWEHQKKQMLRQFPLPLTFFQVALFYL